MPRPQNRNLSANNPRADNSTASGEVLQGLRFQPMLVACAALALGIVIDKLFVVPWLATIGSCIAALFFFVLFAVGKREHLACIALLIAITFFGAGWHHFRWNLYPANDIGMIAKEVSEPVSIRGTVLSLPTWVPAPEPSPLVADRRGDSTRMMIRVTHIRNQDKWAKVCGKTDVFVNGHVLTVGAGDQIQIAGMLGKPSPPMNPGEFDMREKYRLQSCLSRMFVNHPDGLKVLKRNDLFRFDQPIEFLRRTLDKILWQHVDESSAPLASAVLLGNRDQIERDQRRQFMATGTVHLLAISGLHVGILATTFLIPGRLGWVPRNWSLFATMLFVGLYAWIVDFRPPVTRAAILISMYCIGRLIGRQPFSFNSLALAAVMVLAVNPAELFQSGAQLSFLAVATIVVCQLHFFVEPSKDPLDRLIEQSRPAWQRAARRFGQNARRAVAVSFAIWVVTSPLVASRFHIFAPSGVLLNPILMIPIWFALLSGFVVLMTGWLLPPAASAAGMICDWSLTFIRVSIQFVEPMALSHWWVSGASDFWLAVFYGSLAMMFVVPVIKIRKRWLLAFFSLWLTGCLLFPEFPKSQADARAVPVGTAIHESATDEDATRSPLKVTAINVGHGTSILIEYPEGARVLYDGGSLTSPFAASNHISSLLWHKRIDHLDAIIISHADADHYNGIPDLITKFSVGQIFVSPTMFEDRSEAVQYLALAIERAGISVATIRGGQQINCDDLVKTRVLLPTSDDLAESDNARSIVLSIEYGNQKVILPGDLELEGMERLLTTPNVDYDLAMSPHHGSRTGEHAEFAKWATPEYVIVSSDEVEVDDSVREAYGGASIYNTAEFGAVEFSLDGERLSVGILAD